MSSNSSRALRAAVGASLALLSVLLVGSSSSATVWVGPELTPNTVWVHNVYGFCSIAQWGSTSTDTAVSLETSDPSSCFGGVGARHKYIPTPSAPAVWQGSLTALVPEVRHTW